MDTHNCGPPGEYGNGSAGQKVPVRLSQRAGLYSTRFIASRPKYHPDD